MTEYYPAQTTILPMTTIRRERLLPPGVVGRVAVRDGDSVGAFDVIAQGVRSARFVVLNLIDVLGVQDPADVVPLLHVTRGEAVEKGQVIAGDREQKRGLVQSPVNGRVKDLIDGRLVLQAIRPGEGAITVRAGFNGMVVSLRPGRGAVVETTGALVQGVWGSGGAHFGMLRPVPPGGLTALEVGEFSAEWRGTVALTQAPLDRAGLRHAKAAGVGAIVAPGMHAGLRRVALDLEIPIILTEGFGAGKMSTMVYNVLEAHFDRQVAVNAVQPNRWQPDRPEVIVPFAGEGRPPAPAANEPLRLGVEVRITRKPYLGVVAKVKRLPHAPQVIENGLRLPVAEVTLPSGRTELIPLVNLELFGRGG